MKTLHLTLKKKWFDMIASGEKKEEYREIKPYWITRLCDINYPEEYRGENKTVPADIMFDIENSHPPKEVLNAYYTSVKNFDTITFKNGYSADAPVMVVELNGIQISEGNPDWGAEPGQQYFVIHLGEIISITR